MNESCKTNCDLCDFCVSCHSFGSRVTLPPEPRPFYMCSRFGKILMTATAKEIEHGGARRISIFPRECPSNTAVKPDPAIQLRLKFG